MTERELTPSQAEILRGLADRFAPERIDRLWVFPPHVVRSREMGLFVLSLHPDDEESSEQKVLVTLRYQIDQSLGKTRREERVDEEGRAPPERIDRVIAGVLARSGMDADEPIVEDIEREPDRWAAFLDRLGVVA
jgi:hypothetical protein